MLKVEKDPDSDEIHVLVDDTELEITDVDGDRVFVECTLDDIKSVPVKEVAEGLALHMHESSGFGTYLFHEAETRLECGVPVVDFICHQPNKYWEGRWGLATLLSANGNQLPHHGGLKIGEIELEDDWKRLVVTAATEDATVESNVTRISRELGPAAEAFDVHEVCIRLHQDGRFLGEPYFEGGPQGRCSLTLRQERS